jgi:hypothetical protein
LTGVINRVAELVAQTSKGVVIMQIYKKKAPKQIGAEC